MHQQEELEERMRSMGIDRYWSSVAKSREGGSESHTQPGRKLLGYTVVQLSEALQKWIKEAEAGGAGRRNDAVKYLKQIDADSAAMICARAVLDGITQADSAVALARRVGTMIMDEVLFRQFKEQDELGDHLVRVTNDQTHHYGHKRRIVRSKIFDRGRVDWEDWEVSDLVKVGAKMIDLMITSTGLIEERTHTVNYKRQETTIVATQETMDWIEEEHNRRSVMSPMLLPTIVPPRPWTDPFTGGYWTARVRNLTLVKTYQRNYLRELAEQDLSSVYDAVNAIQSTPWSINNKVLKLVRWLWDSANDSGVIPQAEDIPIPERPITVPDTPKEEWTEDQMEDFRAWKRSATETYSRNARLKSLRLQFVKTLMVAELYEYEPTVYFPHQMDFRGRLYPVPMFLQPQGADLSRGLLQFAEAKPIVDNLSVRWLAIHGANTWGEDKISLDDREQWAMDNQEWIKKIARDPRGEQQWMDADKPFQFLAWCFEWAEFLKVGLGFKSRLPIQMDGSCNGIQNFSAALRDPIGGAAVNLVPGEKPADIYRTVSDVVLEQVKLDAADHERDDYLLAAQAWLQHGISRKECKRPVMTLAYGATRFGFCQQVMDDTVTPYRYEVGAMNTPFKGSGWKAAEYLGGVIWDKVATVVVAARQAMDWFQQAARLAAKEGLPVRWTTPDGFIALQSYPLLVTRRVRLTLGTGNHWLTVATGYSDKLDKRRQANGISPNWVHSMDASHLRATVRSCWKHGITGFSMVHDSYGTHACDAPVLARVLREEFVAMYERPVLEQFKMELELQLPPGETLPDLPEPGTLDLRQVIESQYFFA